ncbi:MAG: SpoIIE family protein phosphatase [Planctomycetes bacterium]|nr:SpoIIE family protein phosphatase [Planctomycetota bacterium]
MEDPQTKLKLSPALQEDLYEVDAFPEIAVLYEPVVEVLEAYGLEPSIGVIAILSGGPQERIAAWEAGALEVLSPDMHVAEAQIRVQTAVARFRTRLDLEADREHLAAQRTVLERNLRLAARLQRSFLPSTLPAMENVEFSTAFLPQEFVSGDSYDVRQLDADHVLIATLDAVGHGVRAALLTVLLRSHIVALGSEGEIRDPHLVVAELNQTLLDARLEESPTAAVCYAILNVKTGVMRLSNAGHPRPVSLLPSGEKRSLGSSGLLLGIDPMTYETDEVQLTAGERVFFFTDGADPGYDEGFSEQLLRHADLELELQVGGALGEVIELDSEGRPEDDITVVGLCWGPLPEPSPEDSTQED